MVYYNINIFKKFYIFGKESVSVFLTLQDDGSKMNMSHNCHSGDNHRN